MKCESEEDLTSSPSDIIEKKMVEETTDGPPEVGAKPKLRARPRPMFLWTGNDVVKWFRRHCGEYEQYTQLFINHDISGKALRRATDDSLKRMGIENNEHRDSILREILKQRLKTDIMEIRELQMKNNIYDNYQPYR